MPSKDNAPQGRDPAVEEALRKLRALGFHERELGDDDYARTRTEERIDTIVGMMVNGSWVPGRSHRILGAEWGLSGSRIDTLAAEAGRVVRRYVQDDPDTRAEMRARILISLERIASKAEQRGSKNGFRDAVAAYTKIAEIYSLVKQEVRVEATGRSRFDGWTDEQIEHYTRTGQTPEQAAAAGTSGGQDG